MIIFNLLKYISPFIYLTIHVVVKFIDLANLCQAEKYSTVAFLFCIIIFSKHRKH